MRIVTGFWEILKEAAQGFRRHKVLKLSASLAYYTIFSIGPMLLVVIFLSNLFWGRAAIEGKIYGEISGMVGHGAASQVQAIIKSAAISGGSVTAVISFLALLIAATSAFVEMQDSLNTIWDLRPKSGTGWKLVLLSRGLSFAVVAFLGFLLLMLLVVSTLLDGFSDRIHELVPGLAVALIHIVNLIVTLLAVSALFAIIFKVLPDAVIRWKDVIAGALFTAVLFVAGKAGITYYLATSKLDSAYGSAGSLVVLLLWIYYSAVIVYFGAEFTKAYALRYGAEIRPNEYAVSYKISIIENGRDSLQRQRATNQPAHTRNSSSNDH